MSTETGDQLQNILNDFKLSNKDLEKGKILVDYIRHNK